MNDKSYTGRGGRSGALRQTTRRDQKVSGGGVVQYALLLANEKGKRVPLLRVIRYNCWYKRLVARVLEAPKGSM